MKNTTFTTEAGAWERISRGKRYRRFAAKEAWNAVTQKIKEDVFDGILLNLSERNSGKTTRKQERILRRIVEKRQAQATFKQVGRSENLLTASLANCGSARCMKSLHKYRWCA